MATWRELGNDARANGLADHEVRIVLAEVASEPFARLAARLDVEVAEADARRVRELVARRTSGVPLQHVLGHWSFRSLELAVDRRALIPRPETELLVEVALRELERVRRATGRSMLRALDLGTGTGAIAASLVAEDDEVVAVGIDRSLDALCLAAANRDALAVGVRGRLSLVASDWFEAFGPLGRFDVIVANPPYVSIAEWEGLPAEVRDHDPRRALVAGESGLEDLERICAGAPHHLADDGALVVELAPHQAGAVTALATGLGATAAVERDLAEREEDRVAAVVSVEAPEALARAADALVAGTAIVVPTDTVYGLAALAASESGTEAIFALKTRPGKVALPVLVADLAQARSLAVDDARLEALAGAFWPGALTVVARRAPGHVLHLGGDEATVGLRCPAAPFVRALAARVGPLAVTSANRHGDEPCTSVDEVRAIFGEQLLVFDGGVANAPVSSVVSLLGERLELLRSGAILLEQLESALARASERNPGLEADS